MNLFQHAADKLAQREAPLAARMRPCNFAEFVGQEHIVGQGRALRLAIEADQLPSIIIWGPPGSGKTTLAHVIASITQAHFISVSAVNSGVADLRHAVEVAQEQRQLYGKRIILFIDEIHRFNKSQQDAILPYVESGTLVLIGATTENPSFEVISPLLSRCRVFVLKALSDGEIEVILKRAVADEERGLGGLGVAVEEAAWKHLVVMSNGDARIALNALEMAALATPPTTEGQRHIPLATMEDALQQRALLYDRAGDQHYDTISALHKSLRGSDPDAALYWLGRMLEAGEDPLYVARRLVRFASEDVGLADPQALVVAMAAQQAVHFIGMPEGNLALAEATVYLATAPKSNSLYTAYSQVQEDVAKTRNEPVPYHIRNPVTPLMKKLGYGTDYKYPHRYEGHFVEDDYLPPSLKGRRYYHPSEQGFEKEVGERLWRWWGERKGKKPEDK